MAGRADTVPDPRHAVPTRPGDHREGRAERAAGCGHHRDGTDSERKRKEGPGCEVAAAAAEPAPRRDLGSVPPSRPSPTAPGGWAPLPATARGPAPRPRPAPGDGAARGGHILYPSPRALLPGPPPPASGCPVPSPAAAGAAVAPQKPRARGPCPPLSPPPLDSSVTQPVLFLFGDEQLKVALSLLSRTRMGP